jgi:hypothetical protein
MKNVVFWDVTPCSAQHASVAVTANVVPSSPFLFTLMMEALHPRRRHSSLVHFPFLSPPFVAFCNPSNLKLELGNGQS